MAGVSVGEAPDNPVAINLTAMVDIIFCLCVFFMCSLHFKQLEGKFDTWLPKGKGGTGGVADANSPLPQEIRIALQWDESTEVTQRMLGTRKVPNDDELQQLIKSAYDDFVKLNRPDIPVTIDAEARVPMDDVIRVVNLCKRDNIQNIEFALGAPPPGVK